MKLEDFKVGDLLVITGLHDERAAVVIAIDFQGNGLVTYAGEYREDLMPSGTGVFCPEQFDAEGNGLGRFCPRRVRVVGHREVWREGHWYPRPGDRGYDLMC